MGRRGRNAAKYRLGASEIGFLAGGGQTTGQFIDAGDFSQIDCSVVNPLDSGVADAAVIGAREHYNRGSYKSRR